MTQLVETDYTQLSYQSQDGNVSLNVIHDTETVWLTQSQMAELFDKDRKTVTRHIANIYDVDKELDRKSTSSKFELVQFEGDRKVRRFVEHYSLDVTISVGYRVKSKRGVQFRQWATVVLRKIILKNLQPAHGSNISVKGPITVNINNSQVHLQGNALEVGNVKTSINEPALNKEKEKLIDVLKEMIHSVQDQPEAISGVLEEQVNHIKKMHHSLPKQTIDFIQDLGNEQSTARRLLSGLGIAKKTIEKSASIGTSILKILGLLS